MKAASTGRAPSLITIRARAARHSTVAIQALADIASDTQAQAADRVSAAIALLEFATDKTSLGGASPSLC